MSAVFTNIQIRGKKKKHEVKNNHKNEEVKMLNKKAHQFAYKTYNLLRGSIDVITCS